MKFLPTTHFRVLQRTQDFPLDFQVTHATDYVCVIANSNNETYTLSPLVIEQRLRQGRIEVIAFPAHPSHRMDTRGRDAGMTDQCAQCMLKANEEQIQFECALPEREILGPDSFGGSDFPHSEELRLHDGSEHPWIKRGPGPLPRTTAMPIPGERPTSDNTICPACVLQDPRLRLCHVHLNCPTCGNPRVLMCPACMTEVTR